MKFFAENGIDHLELIPDGLGNAEFVATINGTQLSIQPITSANNGLTVDGTGSNLQLGGALVQATEVVGTASFPLTFNGGFKVSNLPTPLTAAQAGGLTVGNDGAIVLAPIAPGGPATGDLSGSFPAPVINSGAVTTAKIADGAVVDAKIANVAFSKVTGTSVLVVKTDTIPGTSDLSGTYGSPSIKNGAVTSTKLAAKAVNTANIGDKQVTAAQIADATITGAQLDPATTVSSVNGQFGAVSIAAGLQPTKEVVTKTATYQLTAADSGKVFSPDAAAAGPITFTLPASPVVGQFYEFVSANQNVEIDGGSSKIRVDNLLSDVNNKWTSNRVNGYSIIACLYPNEWIVLTFRNQWTLSGN